MASVTLHNHGVTIEAQEAGDVYVDQALERAGLLYEQSITFDTAIVDRFDGLVLTGPSGAWHFRTPVCGYDGLGPQTTALILELFGFGTRAEILAQITTGENNAKARFNR